MKLDDFNYNLPESLIAKFPLEERSASRLMILTKMSMTNPNYQISHSKFIDIINYLNPGDLLLFNNTKVMPAYLEGYKASGGRVEILIEKTLSKTQAEALIFCNRPLKKDALINIKSKVGPKKTLPARVIDKTASGHYLLDFQQSLMEILTNAGNIPLPPYLKRQTEAIDEDRYQTIYAKELGAIAAPTAGLHFDSKIFQQLTDQNVQYDWLTLHIGSGTFKPVRSEIISQHKMHEERFSISASVCNRIKQTKANGKRVIAVGTTTVRALESAMQQGELKAQQEQLTNLFITPGYKFKIVDALVTNFHLPKSTLLMLVSAFANRSAVLNAYAEAIAKKYRFFSYGDAMLIC